MAKAKTVEKGSASVADLLAKFQTDMGEAIGSYGGKLAEADRCPTGLFELDLALGGGFPRGRATSVYGPESSNKTNIALSAIRQNQILRPHQTNVFVDIEGSFDPAWAKLMGVDTDKLVVIKPSYAEQVVDIVESFMYADDCGIIVIDSLAAMVTTQEIESTADKALVGGAALVVGKLVRKSTLAFIEADKKGLNNPTLIYINQIRHKIGVMFGNPETTPGGNAPLFQSSIRLRTYGKNVIDSKVSQVMPVAKEVQFVIHKWKVPILSTSGKFTMLTQADDKKYLGIGDCDDFSTVLAYLKDMSAVEKNKNGWEILSEQYPTQDAFRIRINKDRKFGNEVRNAIIENLLNGQTIKAGEIDPETGEIKEEA